MSKQKSYQQLRKPENRQAAEEIWMFLKANKTMSQKTFDMIYMRCNKIRTKHGAFDHLTRSTIKFLKDHGLVTRQEINGLIIWVATQKCWRSKTFENATIEYQYVTDLDVDRGIEYQTLNNGLVPAQFEGKVIAQILGLEGKVAKQYAQSYIWYYDNLKDVGMDHKHIPMKFAVINPVREMIEIKKI